MLALVLLLLAAPSPKASKAPIQPSLERTHDLVRAGRAGGRIGVQPLAFFEFAPLSGAGMGTACACTTPSGAKGETLTFTRATAATCSKTATGPYSTTGIANGDLVTCASGQPRVVYDPSGVLGLWRETAHTNNDPQSQAIDNGVYTDFVGTGGTTPVLNGANAAVDPYGTSTAEAYTFAATSGTQSSARAINVATAAATSCGGFVKGQSGSGTMDFCLQTSATPTATCSPCSYTSTSYSWCKVENVTSIASGNCYFGNLTSLNGGTARASNAVYISQVDVQPGTFLHSPIVTTSVALTANGDSAIGVAGSYGTPTQGSLAISIYLPSLPPGNSGAISLDPAATTDTFGHHTGSANDDFYVGNALRVAATGTLTVGATNREAYVFGSTTSIIVNGTTTSVGTFAPVAAITRIGIGEYFGANLMDGVISRACYDPDPTRCR